MSEEGRQLNAQSLPAHWNSGVPMLIPLEGDPRLFLRVDAPHQRLTLRTPVGPEERVPVDALTHVQIAVVTDAEQRYLEISTIDERLLIDGYTMLSAIADRIQLDGISPVAALEETLAKWHAILSARTRMSQQAEIGLFGELLVLESLLSRHGDAAVDSWRGPLGEEHDFGFADADMEVKTTIGERRRHWIHGLDQLSPTPPAPLWLLSVQITRGGLESGRRLGRLVADGREAIQHDVTKTRLSERLAANAWREADDELFSQSWRLRSEPLALYVDDAFPRLTSQRLVSCGMNIETIGQINYEIDLSGRKTPEISAGTIDDLVEDMGRGADV
jgi:hypothetical protein